MKIRVKVSGMHCPSCEKLINMTLEENPLIEKVTSSHQDGVVEIEAKQGINIQSDIFDVIAGLGYTPESCEEVEQ